MPCGRKSINLWKLLSLRGLAGYGVGSNPINLYKVSLLRAMGWLLPDEVAFVGTGGEDGCNEEEKDKYRGSKHDLPQ